MKNLLTGEALGDTIFRAQLAFCRMKTRADVIFTRVYSLAYSVVGLNSFRLGNVCVENS